MKSFADPDTHFTLLDGDGRHHKSGKVKCDDCGAVSRNIDDFPHKQSCPQRFVHSKWYAEQLQG
jgi:hypothetical protein